MTHRPTAGFSWDDLRRQRLGSSLPAPLNMAEEAVDRHAAGPRKDHSAIVWVGPGDETRIISFADLKERTDQMATLLDVWNLRKGDRVAFLCERVPEFYMAALGAMKQGAVICTIYTDLGPEPIHHRLAAGGARVLVTTERLYQRKAAELRSRLPGLDHVLVTDRLREKMPGVWDWEDVSGRSPRLPLRHATTSADMAFIQFTSGTTGLPKAAVHVHEALLMHEFTGRQVLDLRPDDVFWCTADPGWVTGTVYGMITPLLLGVTTLVDGCDFDMVRWLKILESRRVSVWYTSPSALRRMMRADFLPRERFSLDSLRAVFCVGEALSPDVVAWTEKAFGAPVRDTWWQTETGGILIAHPMGVPVRPGSMGRVVPGIQAAVLKKDDAGEVTEQAEPGEPGELAIQKGWPSMFRDYLNETPRYEKRFAGDWYLTGDRVRRDADGYFWFVGRGDDMIKTSGYWVGPFEVERVLTGHPAVAEACVVGVPDSALGERVKACVILRPGFSGGDGLRRDISAHARRLLGPAIAPREIEFVEDIPKNKAGKILRRVVKSRSGEASTLQGDTHDHSKS